MTPPNRQPPDNGTPAWLYDQMERRFDDLVRRMDKHGLRLEELAKRLEDHDQQDQLVENRVLRIEVEREGERERQAAHIRRITIDNSKLAATIATGASIIVQIIKSTWETYRH